MTRFVASDRFNNPSGRQSVGQECIIGMVASEPGKNIVCLWMEDEFASLQTYRSFTGDTSALHYPFDVFEAHVFPILLPDVAMPAL